MRNYLLILVLLIALCNTQVVFSRSYVIGVSPNIPQQDSDLIFKKVVAFLLDNVHSGENAVLYDAYHNHKIGVFQVPNKAAYDNPKPKVRYNESLLKQFKLFLSVDSRVNASSNMASLLMFPQFLSFVGENITEDQMLDVILIGSPLYVDFKEKSFSMTEGYVPSDGHIRASIRDSIFGTAERKNLLKNIKIHYLYRDVNWLNDLHREMVQRFWALYVDHQGGHLATFVSDTDTVFKRAAISETKSRRNYDLNPDTKLEMISIQREVDKRRIEAVFDKNIEATLPLPQEFKGKVLVGIKWDCLKCDLDLYASPNNRSEVLFYGKTNSSDGTYHKDYLDSPTPVNGLEYIKFKRDLDVKNLLIAVNFYNGDFPNGPSGEVRLELNGRVYAKSFHIASSQGNHGKDVTDMHTSSYWVTINPMDIVMGR